MAVPPYKALSQKASTYLYRMCVEIQNRRVGSPGNREATDFFARTIESFGFSVESQVFDCIYWTQAGALLAVNGLDFEVFPSPYSPGCQTQAPLVVASTIEELQSVQAAGKILLLHGEIASEPLMPKNFTFYNPEEHQRIIRLLEEITPTAIITATGRNPQMAGGMYPFPLIEDGDFDIPSLFTDETVGRRLVELGGKQASLKSQAQRLPATGCNVIARKGVNPECRIVLFAHIDAKINTPGATDNASGVVVLLLLAELLEDYSGAIGIEIVALNGEDYYSAPGEMQYLATIAGKFDDILLGVNIDGAGFIEGETAFSLYNSPPEIVDTIRRVFSGYPGMVEGEQWYQSDHTLFVINQRPALALTSLVLMDPENNVTHTPEDRPEIVDVTKLTTIALALRDLIVQLDAESRFRR